MQYCMSFFKSDLSRPPSRSRIEPYRAASRAGLYSHTNIDGLGPPVRGSAQAPFCPFEAGLVPQQPLLGYAPIPAALAADPVLVVGAKGTSAAGVAQLAEGLVPGGAEVGRMLRGNLRLATDSLFGLLVARPLLSCAGRDGLAAVEPALCALLQHGQGPPAPCCVDLTADTAGGSGLNGWRSGLFTGRLQQGLNYWSPNPAHTDSAYEGLLAACLNRSTTDASSAEAVGACNAQLMAKWAGEGVRYGSGFGAAAAAELLGSLIDSINIAGGGGMSAAALLGLVGDEQFRCVMPGYSPAASARLPADECINLHEGLARLAEAEPLPASLLPDPEPLHGVPNCTQRGDCLFDGVPGVAVPVAGFGGGRWAQECDYYTAGWAERVQALGQAGDAPGLVRFLGSLPCVCIWLIVAPQVASSPPPRMLLPQSAIQSAVPLRESCSLQRHAPGSLNSDILIRCATLLLSVGGGCLVAPSLAHRLHSQPPAPPLRLPPRHRRRRRRRLPPRAGRAAAVAPVLRSARALHHAGPFPRAPIYLHLCVFSAH